MREIPTSRSILSYWEELIYLEAALVANEETAPLASPVTATLDNFEVILQRDLDTRRALVRARAHASIADANLDEALREVHSNTLHLVRQDRGRKEYQTLFPGALTAHIRHALARQVEVTRDTLQTLGLSLFDASFRAAQEALLEPRLEQGEVVLAERKDAQLGRAEGRLDIEGWKEEVNAVRLSVYSELLALAVSTRRKRSWAESFFPKASARSSRGTSDVADTDEQPAVEDEDEDSE